MLLLDMPPEILIKIAEGLDLKSLSQLSQASKRFRDLLKEHPHVLMKVLAKASENDLYDYLINNNITVSIYENNQFVPKKPLLTLAQQYHQFFKNKIYDTTRFLLPMRPPLQAHTDWVNALLLLPNNQLGSVSDDYTIKIWNLDTGECLRTLTGHRNWVYALVLLPNNQLASSSGDHTIKIWDIETGTCLRTLTDHTSPVNALVLLPNNRLASGSNDSTIKIWNLETGECLRTLTGHMNWVNALILLPDNRLASGSSDCTIKIWNIETGECLRTLTDHTRWVSALILLPNDQLASCSHDRTIKIWDIETGVCLRMLTGHTDWVTDLVLLSNNRLASGSDDRTTKIWDIKTANCLHTCNLSGAVTSLQYEKGRLYAGLSNGAIQTLDFPRVELDIELRRGDFVGANQAPDEYSGVLEPHLPNSLIRPNRERYFFHAF